eukprot:4468390-Prymnesium_polylepis.1
MRRISRAPGLFCSGSSAGSKADASKRARSGASAMITLAQASGTARTCGSNAVAKRRLLSIGTES